MAIKNIKNEWDKLKDKLQEIFKIDVSRGLRENYKKKYEERTG